MKWNKIIVVALLWALLTLSACAVVWWLEHDLRQSFIDSFELAETEQAIREYWYEHEQIEALQLEQVQDYIEEEDWPDFTDRCFALYSDEQERIISNIPTLAPALISSDVEQLQLRFSEQEIEHADAGFTSTSCSALRFDFDDGSVLLFGYDDALIGYLFKRLWLLILLLSGLALCISLAIQYHYAKQYRQRERELERAQEQINILQQVTDNLAHELRTQLTRLRGQLDLLTRVKQPTEETVTAVQEEADHLLNIFNALLRIATIEQGTYRSSQREFDFSYLLQDIDEMFAPAFADRGIAFTTTITDTVLNSFGDPDLWVQAFSNLLDNALKYTPSGGQVSLHAQSDASGIRIVIHDNGSGIPEADLDKVFQRFYRLPKHRVEKGTGLGLSLVMAICKAHQASIELRNQNGLQIIIQIPKSGKVHGG